MVKKNAKVVDRIVKEELTEVADGKVYRTFTEEDEVAMRTFEGANWCNVTKEAMKAGLPFFILKRRCAYIADTVSVVNSECSSICKHATKAKDWDKFSELCTKSTALWNKTMSEKNMINEPWVV
jgi:hypothetical protein